MAIPLVDEGNYRAEMERTVLPALERCSVEGWMEPASGKALPALAAPGKLHYRCYDAARFDALALPDAHAEFRGAIVVSHGFTEFAAKYGELVWYALLAGYSVCIVEHRGHGYSARDVDDPSLVWIDDWQRYAEDLAQFASTVGKEYANGLPLYLFAHSMGGGVGAAVLERYPTLFDKAVLSSPMIAPETGMANWVTAIVCEAMSAGGRGQEAAMGQKPFSAQLDMSWYQGASEARVRWYHSLRVADSHYQTNTPTYEWVRQALRLSHAVLAKQQCQRIETPVLLFQAEREIWVLNSAENRFVDRVDATGGDIRLVRVPHALHEIFSMPNEVLSSYLHQILDFFDASEITVISEGA